MTNPLSLSAHAGYLADPEIDALLRTVQADVAVDITDDDGTERTVYLRTPESEDAQERLLGAFSPLLHKAARGSSVLDFDDALMVATEEFLSVCRRYEIGSALPFKAGLATILSRKLGDVGRTSGLVVVKENAAARYRQLMDSVEWDLTAAYALVRRGHAEGTGENRGFTPDTFLAVDRAIAVESLDVTLGERDNSLRVSNQGTGRLSASEGYLADAAPSPEDETVQAETVRWLLGLVTDRQEQILRLRYGFCDLPTENSRLAHGYRTGEVLSDRQVADVTGSSTPTVQRQKAAALATMRDALEEVEAA